jgi:hypothetical protein
MLPFSFDWSFVMSTSSLGFYIYRSFNGVSPTHRRPSADYPMPLLPRPNAVNR